jgi:hypothetical protein
MPATRVDSAVLAGKPVDSCVPGGAIIRNRAIRNGAVADRRARHVVHESPEQPRSRGTRPSVIHAGNVASERADLPTSRSRPSQSRGKDHLQTIMDAKRAAEPESALASMTSDVQALLPKI